MEVTVKITKKAYIKLIFYLNRVKLGVVLFCAIFLFIIIGLSLLNVIYLPTDMIFVFSGFALIFGFLHPFMFYIRTSKYYDTYRLLQETVIYRFLDDIIYVKGETYSSELGWNKLFKVVELKSWILMYSNKYQFYILSKDSFGDQINDFRKLVRSKSIPSRLQE